MLGIDFEEQQPPDSVSRLFAPAKRPRGRPGVSESELLHNRDEFVYLLEMNWGEIGWRLQTAKRIADIRDVLSVIKQNGFNANLGHFLRVPTISKTDAATIRSLRRQLAAIRSQLRAVSLAKRELCDSVQGASNAVAQTQASENRGYFESVLAARENQLRQNQENTALLSKRFYEARDHLEEHEALFAQKELLHCIRSRRYSFTPVKLANAMAGLPRIGWRQSAKRLAGCKCSHSYPPYEVFRIIEAALRRSVAQKKPLLDCLRARITKMQNDWDLRQNWYYLRRAVEEVGKQKLHPQERPFRIAAEYEGRWQHASAADRILAEGERLA